MSTASGTLEETIEATQSEGRAAKQSTAPELAQGDLVGRYVVLSRLGAGAMGVVYAAYDPELDRKVAVKLLQVGSGGDHRRLLREAQAMARLQHPNVVAVHDVGEHEGRVFVAMEFVEGRTARQWVSDTQPSWPEVLDVFAQAGRGLQAAHEKGLVHRDFKPDNVMVEGGSRRVRVMDFGLARAGPPTTESDPAASSRASLDVQLTQHGAIMGTPAYMAPEQLGRKDSGAQADQFSFCVSVWEAVFGRRPFAGSTVPELVTHVVEGRITLPPAGARAPRWLRRALLRGLAVDPAERWPSMDALVVELSRGRARARRRVALAGVFAVALVGASALAWRQNQWQQRRAGCHDEGASIDAVWNDEQRESLHAGLVASGAAHAELTADKVMPWLDAQASAWADARTTACVSATIDQDPAWTPDVHDRALWCLEERRLELHALVTELTRSDPGTVSSAVPAAANLQPVAPCLDVDLLLRRPSPPADRRDAVQGVLAELARAVALEAMGAYADGLDVANAAVEHADAVAWQPLSAAARHRTGQLLVHLGRYPEAEAELERAYFDAAAASASEIAADTADDLAHLTGVFAGRPRDGMRWSHHAEAHHAAIPDPSGLREANHLHALASVHWEAGRYAEAQPLHERALELREHSLGPDHPDVAQSLSRVAIVLRARGKHAEARVLIERALGILMSALGPDHPEVAIVLINLGNVHQGAGDYAEGRRCYERALAIEEAAAGREHPIWARAVISLGNAYHHVGESERAIALYERGLPVLYRALGPKHPEFASGLLNLANAHLILGAAEQSRALQQQALEINEAALGPDHPDVGQGLHNLGTVEWQLKRYAEAREFYRRALVIYERAFGPDHPDLALPLLATAIAWDEEHEPAKAIAPAERALALLEHAEISGTRLAAAQFVLARALWGAGQQRSRALELADQARDGYREGGPSFGPRREDVDRWLAERRGVDIEH